MDVSGVGLHCTFCSALDFLPIKCDQCLGYFCRQHASLDAHQCPVVSQVSTHPSPSNTPTNFASYLPDPNRHNLPAVQPPNRNEAAQALLRKNFASAPKPTVKTLSKKPLPKDPKLRMMILKQRAKPVDPSKAIAPSDRLHFRLRDATKQESAELELYTSKAALLGKVVDQLAKLMAISAKSDKTPVLCHIVDGQSRQLQGSLYSLSSLGLEDDAELELRYDDQG